MQRKYVFQQKNLISVADDVPADLIADEAFLDDETIHAIMLKPDAKIGLDQGEIRRIFSVRDDASQLLRAYHIMQWREDSRFCGSCGVKNEDSRIEIARVCPACGRIEYPRICPAIITLVSRGDKILLAHNKKFLNRIYSLIAGFTEAGETLEETVTREVREEVGIEVKNIRYAFSQAWPFPNSLMAGFYADWAGGEIQTDTQRALPNSEIEDARWWTRDNLPELPFTGSVARKLIEQWLGN
ncbi:MAG: NAD(+) diphosphatase [Spirochaetaceae bacterium]|jgi:NAD+ diphosphatase|nr:NAD(+) diphosphatase [Spirochaetaceae bacterium]